MRNNKKQNGYLILASVALITIFAFIGVTLNNMTVNKSVGGGHLTAAIIGYYVAEAGLEDGLKQAKDNPATPPSITNKAMGTVGTYTVTSTLTIPYNLTSVSTINNSTVKIASKSVQATITPVSSYDIWASARNKTAYKWSGSAWVNSSPPGANSNLNSLDILSSTLGYAVGNSGRVWNFTGTWGSPTQQFTNTTPYWGVSVVSTAEAWIVGGTLSGPRFGVLYSTDQGVWCSMPCGGKTIPANTIRELLGVHVIDTNADGLGNIGFAVGRSGRILRYNGTNWVNDAAPAGVTSDIRKVFVVSLTEAWAITSNREILKWNGTSWSVNISGSVLVNGVRINQALNSISMCDTNANGQADIGFAVANGGYIYQYNTSLAPNLWTEVVQAAGSNENYVGVRVPANNYAIAATLNGRLATWNGSAWSIYIPPGGLQQFTDIVSIPGAGGSSVVNNWRDVNN